MQKRVLMKRVAFGFLGFLAILVAAAIIIPLFINIDQYRPQIVDIANQHINGKLSISKLSLSLWGQVEIDIDGIELEDVSANKLLSVKETYAQISFLSILTGQPHLVFRMDQPNVAIVKDKNSKINLLGLVKETPPGQTPSAQQPPAKDTPAAKGGGSGSGDVPFLSMIKAAGLDVELIKAKLTFRDQLSGFSQDVSNFNMVLKDISMTRPMSLRIWADIVTKAGDTVQVSGPLNMVGVIKPQFDGLDFKNVDVDLDATFDDLDIRVADTFHKAKGTPTNFRTALSASTSRLEVKSFNFKFHNAEVDATALVEKMQEPDPVVKLKLTSKPIDLASWGTLIPPLKDFDLEGKMTLGANAEGAVSKLAYDAKLAIQDMVAKAPGLAHKPKMQVLVDVVTDELKTFQFDMAAPGNDLVVKANIKSFSAPKINVTVNSANLDLDQLLPPPPKDTGAPAAAKQVPPGGGEPPAEKASEKTAAQQKSTQPATDVDAALEPIRTNAMLKNAAANVAVRIKKFHGMKVTAQDINVDFSFKDLVASIDNFSMLVWKGLIKANAGIDLKPKSPTYQMNLNVSNIDLQQAVETQLESFKNTVIGLMAMKAQGSGKSLNSDQILKNLNLTGNLKIAEAKFASIDVGAMVVDGLNNGLKDVVAQIPALKDKKIKDMKNFKSRYKLVGGDFSLRSGVFLSQNFETVSYPKEGIDLKGLTEADLVNDKLSAQWMIIDTYDVTEAKQLDVDVNGVKVEHILAKGDEPVSFPVKVGCKLSAPCYDYGAIPKHLSGIALENTRNAVKGLAKKEVAKVKEKAKEEAKKQQGKAKEKAKQEVDKQKGKLFKKFGL